MSALICPDCARFRTDDVGPACPTCGAVLVPPEEAHLEGLVRARLRGRIEGWREQQLIDSSTAIQLVESLDAPAEPPPVKSEPAREMSVEKRADAWAESIQRLVAWRPGWGREFFRSLEEAARAEQEVAASEPRRPREGEEDGERDLGLAMGSGSALFGQGGTGALGGGLDTLVSLDADGGPREKEGALKLHEYVWWFLGALLVLGGSLMGVREAWRALGGVPRQLIVTGALFAYHAGFIGLGVFLGRRSLSAGRVLAGIGLSLLPIVFVALAALVGLAPGVGVPCALGFSALCLATLRLSGRLLHGTTWVALAWALMPSLLAELPLMGLGDALWMRVLLSFPGVAALGMSLWRSSRAGEGRPALISLGLALYGSLALALFSVASGPDSFDALQPGSPLFAGMALWAASLATVVAAAAMRDSARQAYPRAAPVVEVVAHAVMVGSALAGGVSAFSSRPGSDPWVDVASAFTPAAVALAFFLLEPRRRVLLHLGVLAATLSGFLLARLQVPEDAAGWCVGVAVVAAGLLLLARRTMDGGVRLRLLLWGTFLSVMSMPLVHLAAWAWGTESVWPSVVTGALIAVAAHGAAGHRWRGLHYLGGAAVSFAVLAALGAFPRFSLPWTTLAFFVLAGSLYGIAALVHRAWVRRHGGSLDLSPLDDLSLGGATLGVLLFFDIQASALPVGFFGMPAKLQAAAISCVPTLIASGVLLLRARRDRSRVLSFLAATGVALAVVRFSARVGGTSRPDSEALVLAVLVLGFALIAALRGRAERDWQGARRLLGIIPLPFPESGRPLITDGFAAMALVLALVCAAKLASWTSRPLDAERSGLLLASGVLVLSALLAFFTRGFTAFRLRGSVVALAAGGLLITLASIINRAGRPLPPDIVAWRLPIIGVGLWGFALVARRFGPWLGRRLENESHGRLYHWVPHAGVAALAGVLVTGAASVGAPSLSRALGVVPPLMLLGPAVLSLLLAASFRARSVVHVGLLLGLAGAALWAAQQALVGPSLTALAPPNAQWVRTDAIGYFHGGWLDPQAWVPPGVSPFLVWQRGFAGIAAAGLAYAGVALVQVHLRARFVFLRRLLSWVPEELREAHAHSLGSFTDSLGQSLRDWATTASVLVFAAAFFLPGISSALLVLATGPVLFLARARRQAQGILGAGILLVVHALAHRAENFEVWPGPVLALLALATVSAGSWIARRREGDAERIRMRFRLASSLYALAGTVYALAVDGIVAPHIAVPQLFRAALEGLLSGRWMLWAAVPMTVALVAAIRLAGAFPWRGVLASLEAAWGSILAGLALACGLAAVWGPRLAESEDSHLGLLSSVSYPAFFSSYGAALALGVAVWAALAHAGGQWLRERRRDLQSGLGVGRDVWLIGCGALLATVAALVQDPGAELLPQALAALGLSVIVALHCAWSEHTGRHVYFVQVAVVGVYGMVRALYATSLRPEHDALFALGLGFVLVGITVLARRAGIPPVADATRRFAALLPLFMAWVLPSGATGETALLAGGSGLLYAAIGAVEQSRWFGSLAAAACNLALLIAALAFGLDGLEIYLAPLGLLMLMLGQLFASSLPQAARNAIRFLGGFLLYVPAAAKLSLEVGLAADGAYALVFGAVCLVGVAVGMVLHIRAYLALGSLFLTLDVVANLVHAGLRDHRIGFMVMTFTGLTIVTGRVLATLKRQQVEHWMRRVRVELRGWD
ncbi:hypothetical protein [Hyalangium versicolor]|uniref:hypothetical protein n=1 Tax=Hyalangium versicolor TaxID=2861190 RepID=UPI001CD02CBA|nr:hypothetical protein [Hyalangium versicolor]